MSNEQTHTVDSDQSKEAFLAAASALYDKHKHVVFSWTTGRQRSPKQNNSLHLWLGWVAKTLNDAGLDMRKVLKPTVEIPWTGISAKKHLWKPIQEAMLNKKSTTEPERGEYPQVEETLARHLNQKFGVTIPDWPNKRKK